MRSIARGKTTPFAEIVFITPEVARELLARNPQNRKLDEKHAMRIANDITHGRWRLNGETIIVSDDGLLNDGQNRLYAIVLSGVGAPSVVFFGAERESRLTVDMGNARTSGSFLHMQGIEHSNQKAAVVPILMAFERGIYHALRPTKTEITHYYNANAKEIDAAVEAVGNHKFSATVGRTGILCARVVLSRVDPEACDEFFYLLLTGANLSGGDPILFAREHLMSSHQDRMRPVERFELILRYWNAWRQNKSLHRCLSLKREHPEIV